MSLCLQYFRGQDLMKNYIITGLSFVVVALLVGGEPIQRTMNEALYRGSLRGAEECVSYSSGRLLSPEAVRTSCVSKFEKQLFGSDYATGRAGPRLDKQIVAWGGELENKSADHVTTSIRVTVIIFDKDGKETEFSGGTSIWIDPMSHSDFRVKLSGLEREMLEDINFCEDEVENPTQCMRWSISEVKGLSI
jgi:hypothetical protein